MGVGVGVSVGGGVKVNINVGTEVDVAGRDVKAPALGMPVDEEAGPAESEAGVPPVLPKLQEARVIIIRMMERKYFEFFMT